MSRELGSEIRRLQWGLIPNEPMYVIQVKTKANLNGNTWFISQIIEDKNTFLEHGHFEYLIYISKDGTIDNQYFWKRMNARPDAIEYFVDDKEVENLV